MKVVYLSNSFNHYQKAFSDEMYKLLKNEYFFIECKEQEQERLSLGWNTMEAPYLIRLYKNGKERCIDLVNKADALIYGPGVVPFYLVKERAKAGKLIIACTERILKKGDSIKYFVPRYIKYNYYFLHRKNTYLLCMGAYVHSDFSRMGLFQNRSYRFGYFPQFKLYDLKKLIESKKKNSFVWVGRMIDWKHPEYALDIASQLSKRNIIFELNMIGNGELLQAICKEVRKRHLEDRVHVLGPKSPEDVRIYMEMSEFYLFTSDRNEGWGVVLNEAMNSGCVPIANCNIGSVPYMLEDGINGFIYNNEENDKVLSNIISLIDDPKRKNLIAREAYKTIEKIWNPTVAASRVVDMINDLKSGKTMFKKYIDGPCSKL